MRMALVLMLCSGVVACGGSQQPVDTAIDNPEPRTRPKRSGGAPSVDAEVGALDADEVKTAFEHAMPAIDRCLKSGQQKLPMVEGEIQVFVRVAGDGSTAWAFPLKATFGHRATETCIVEAITAQKWPSPQGGREGETTQSLSIETNERPALQWQSSDLGKNGAKALNNLKQCRAKHSSGHLSVTFYVDPDGKMMASGSSSADATGREALRCAAQAPEGLVFNSPGSYPAKITLTTQ